MKNAVYVLLLCFVPSLALASNLNSDWDPVDFDTNGELIVFVNKLSIAPRGQEWKAWVAFYHANGQYDRSTKKTFKTSKQAWAINCIEKTFAIYQSIEYSGNLMDNTEPVHIYNEQSAAERKSDIVPDSISARVLSYVCANLPKK